MLNKIFLQGRFVSDPELKHTPNGVAVASFRLAVEHDFKNKTTGEKGVDFVNIVAWREKGEFVSRFFTKGRMATVVGRLLMRPYTDRDGNKRIIAEVVADDVYFADSRPKEGNSSEPAYASDPANSYSAQTPPGEYAEITENDGDLPF